jgi:hypothetical protein
LLNRQNTFDIITVELLPGYGVDDGWLDAEKWE